MGTYLLTWNPKLWSQTEGEWLQDMEVVAAGGRAPGTWSTGHTKRIQPGDRAYLLRQGEEPRGIVASGWFTSEVFQDEHFNKPSEEANYAAVEWDAIMWMDHPLPTEVLMREVPGVKWRFVLASGHPVGEHDTDLIDALWSAHIQGPSNRERPPGGSAGQGHVQDSAVRKEIEDHAQSLLTAHYIAEGWDVTDRRHGNPYDAIAVKDGKVVFLEAKGTQGERNQVLVTHGEVAFALDHPGQCVMGIVTGIVVDEAGKVQTDSGKLTLLDWRPEHGDLVPVTYTWHPDWQDESAPQAMLSDRQLLAVDAALATIQDDRVAIRASASTMLDDVPIVVIGTAEAEPFEDPEGLITPLYVLIEDHLDVRNPF